jgi:hypothetical protein
MQVVQERRKPHNDFLVVVLGERKMKRLGMVLMVLALLVTTTGMVFAGVDWDGDPILSVGGTTVYVDYGFEEPDFLLHGGQIKVLCEAPQIRLIDSGPDYVTTRIKSGGDKGHLLVTTTLQGKDVPKEFQVRVTVPGKGEHGQDLVKIFTVHNRETINFEMPR